MSGSLKGRLLSYYEANETRVDLGFFLGGFLFDVVTLSDIDDWFSVVQQIVYLVVVGTILFYEFLADHQKVKVEGRFARFWNYRQVAVHFLLGSLLSVYSLFFLKSSSAFSSIVFVLALMGIMVANELKAVQNSKINMRFSLFTVSLFSFYCIIIPTFLGFVGWIPFTLSTLLTVLTVHLIFKRMRRRFEDSRSLNRSLLAPAYGVVAVFTAFYLFGWIPPVPLAVKHMGIYHNVERNEEGYVVSFEKPWWKFWQTGDQDFLAEPGDQVHLFATVYSPARFDDSVFLHWLYKDPKQGWQTADRIPMRIVGGRQNGYRGHARKQNYAEGEWRVSIETTDRREIGRIYFTVTKAIEQNPNRVLEQQIF